MNYKLSTFNKYYLLPGSNGSPDAFGAWEDFENNINAINVAAYGNTFNITSGTDPSAGITCDTFAIVVAVPKNNVAASIPSGFHWPKINAASAKTVSYTHLDVYKRQVCIQYLRE